FPIPYLSIYGQKLFPCNPVLPISMHNKKIIIVGASSGIGRSLAELLASKGNMVGITGRRTALLRQLEAKHTKRFYVSTFDIVNTADCIGHLDALAATLGG